MDGVPPTLCRSKRDQLSCWGHATVNNAALTNAVCPRQSMKHDKPSPVPFAPGDFVRARSHWCVCGVTLLDRWLAGRYSPPPHLPEFQCWVLSQRFLLEAFVLTLFPFLDLSHEVFLPIVWPILLLTGFVVVVVGGCAHNQSRTTCDLLIF